MVMRIPPPRRPIQLYVWTKCGYCVKQKNTIDGLSAEMKNWFMNNVEIITIQDPKSHPTIRGYPNWVVRGVPDPGFKTPQQIMNIRRTIGG